MWFAIIGRIKTKDHLHKLNMLQHGDLRCVLCNSGDESVKRFLECVVTWNTRSMCLSWRNMSWVIPNNLKLMFESWCAIGSLRLQRDLWCSLFFFSVVRSIWGYRNSIIF